MEVKCDKFYQQFKKESLYFSKMKVWKTLVWKTNDKG